jgi:hypothetical protein
MGVVDAPIVTPRRRGVTAARVAATQPGAGGVGMPVSTTGPARRARSGGVRKVGVIANAGGSKRPRGWPAFRERLQLTRSRRARASAQPSHLRVLSGGLAAGRVVTNFFRCDRVRRISISVRALAVGCYDGCSIAKPTGSDVGMCVGCDHRGSDHTPRKLVSPYCEAALRQSNCPGLEEAGGGGQVRLRPASRFPSPRARWGQAS